MTLPDIPPQPLAHTPQEVVDELNRHVVGQARAKRAVAVALRNRWRRQQLDPDLARETTPKNILLIGPTGVGKTEIARRLARLADAPFVKVEATRFTEVGYVGRDVEHIVRDLARAAETLAKKRARSRVVAQAQRAAEQILMPALANALNRPNDRSLLGAARAGEFNDVPVKIPAPPPSNPLANGGVFTMNGAPPEALQNIQRLFSDLQNISKQSQNSPPVLTSLPLKLARESLEQQHSDALIDPDAVRRDAVHSAENDGVVFLDEIDKLHHGSSKSRIGADVSREGVQRDLLPILEGASVPTPIGPVKTDHVLFIASGSFHASKPSDLLPELQGRLPVRVEMEPLDQNALRRVLTEPEASLLKQAVAMLAVEGVTLDFQTDGVDALAEIAAKLNADVENIGARRLHTVMERLLEDVGFNASSLAGQTVPINRLYVENSLKHLAENTDLARFIL